MDIVLIRRFILDKYVPYIKYNQGNKNTVADALSIFKINKNQETTKESTYKNVTVS